MKTLRLTFLAIVSFLSLCPRCGFGEDLVAPEYKIKAAFLYNFAKLCEWPTNSFAAARSPLVIGVLGEDPFGPVLDQLVAGRRIEGRPVVIRRFEHVPAAQRCHVLFIANSEQDRLPMIFAALAGRSVLTVGESEQFFQRGGLIRLVKRKDATIGFEVCPQAAAKERLKLSSKLLMLSVARITCAQGKEAR
jgi:hypothetical protein